MTHFKNSLERGYKGQKFWILYKDSGGGKNEKTFFSCEMGEQSW